jgi:hypothetical protein
MTTAQLFIKKPIQSMAARNLAVSLINGGTEPFSSI